MPDEQPKTGGPATAPGWYHSHGVPGEGDARKRMRVLKVGDKSRIKTSRPLKGGAAASRPGEGRPSPVGGDSTAKAFVIAKRGTEMLDTPVFRAGESGDQEAVAVFTGRDRAQQYLDHAGWNGSDEIGELSADDLMRWLLEAEREGIWYATVNPDRARHLAGHPQAVLLLNALPEESADSLIRQVAELAQE